MQNEDGKINRNAMEKRSKRFHLSFSTILSTVLFSEFATRVGMYSVLRMEPMLVFLTRIKLSAQRISKKVFRNLNKASPELRTARSNH